MSEPSGFLEKKVVKADFFGCFSVKVAFYCLEDGRASSGQTVYWLTV